MNDENQQVLDKITMKLSCSRIPRSKMCRRGNVALTGKVRHGLKLLLPVLGDLDRLGLLVCALGAHTLLIGMSKELLEVVGQLGVHNVKEVLAGRTPVLRVIVREVRHHDGVLLDIWPERFHGDLVVVGDVDVIHLFLH